MKAIMVIIIPDIAIIQETDEPKYVLKFTPIILQFIIISMSFVGIPPVYPNHNLISARNPSVPIIIKDAAKIASDDIVSPTNIFLDFWINKTRLINIRN